MYGSRAYIHMVDDSLNLTDIRKVNEKFCWLNFQFAKQPNEGMLFKNTRSPTKDENNLKKVYFMKTYSMQLSNVKAKQMQDKDFL